MKNSGILFLVFALSIALQTVSAQSERGLVRSGNKDFEKAKYPDAEANYKKALEKKNNMPVAVFNLGDAEYKQGRYEDAAKQFELAANLLKDTAGKAKAYHNLGNTFMENRKWEDAIKAYKNSLKLNLKDSDTRYNLAYANAMLQKDQQQQKKQDKNQQNKDDKNKKDKKDNKDNKGDNKDQKDKNGNDKGDKKDEPKKGQAQPKLSKEEAEKLLQALSNEEQKAQQKMQKQKQKAGVVKIEKDW